MLQFGRKKKKKSYKHTAWKGKKDEVWDLRVPKAPSIKQAKKATKKHFASIGYKGSKIRTQNKAGNLPAIKAL